MYICITMEQKKLQVIIRSRAEELAATRPSVHRNKKKYNRKIKHKNEDR